MKPIESKRITLDRKIVLRFPDFDGFVTDYATNISMTGMFIRTNEPQVPGTPLSFELRLEDGAPLVRGAGWVVWAREKREGAERPAGMGVEFTELDRKSRRLVRWLILNQLPEGQPEFDVHAGTASAPITVRVATHQAVRRNRRAGALTALVIFALLAGLVFWRGLGSGSEDRKPGVSRVDPPAPGSPEATEKPRPADPGSSVPGAPAVTVLPGRAPTASDAARDSAPPPGAALEIAADEARSMVRDWARVWSDQDVEAYLSHYASDYTPEGGLTRAEWRSLRRQRLTDPESIRVAVTRIEARVSSDVEARVTLLQTYRAGGYADTVDKVLELGREDGVWKIRRELAD